jgi:hypothetical protein
MRKLLALVVVATFILGVFTIGCRPNDDDRAWYDAKMQKQDAEDRLQRAKDGNDAYNSEFERLVNSLDDLAETHAEIHAQRNACEKGRGDTVTPLYHGNDEPPSWE